MVVFGQIGRGKSAFVKTFLWRQAVFGRRAWVVDPKGEYGDLADAWGVRPVALRPGGAIRLNPLDPGPEDDDRIAGCRRQRAPADGAALLAGQRLPRPEPGAPRAGRLGCRPGRGDHATRPCPRCPVVVEALLTPSCGRRPSSLRTEQRDLLEDGRDVALELRRLVHGDLAACSTVRRHRASTCPRRSSCSTSRRSIRRPRWAS